MKYSVVLVPFPFDDLSNQKLRPAVCLTDPVGPHSHVVLAFVTSRVPFHPLSTDILVQTSDHGFALAGLRVTSTIRLHRLMTVTTAIISRTLGVLPPSLQIRTDEKLRQLFDL